MEETYTIKVSCSNCGYDGVRRIKKGIPIIYYSEEKCPDCGCKALSGHQFTPKARWKKENDIMLCKY